MKKYDISYAVLNQGFKFFSGPLLLLAIPIYLTEDMQGYWFTLTSLAALTVLADLGFTTIVLQFTAHEFSYLKFDNNSNLSGPETNLQRFGSLFRFIIRWTLGVILIAFPIIFIIGYYFLSENKGYVEWIFPWLIYSLSSMLYFLVNIILSFLEGCDKVGEVQKLRFYFSFFNVSLVFLFLSQSFDLYALSFSHIISVILLSSLILRKYLWLFSYLLRLKLDFQFFWGRQIYSLLGRYSISWLSGYFIFSLFTPLAFYFFGPSAAGKVGLSISLITAIFNLSNIWLIISTPKINFLIERKKYIHLDRLFFKCLIYSSASYMILFLILAITVFTIPILNIYVERIVDFKVLIILCVCWYFQLIINSFSVYVRSHKVEPFVKMSVFNAIFVSSFTLLFASHLSFDLFFLPFFLSFLIITPWSYTIFSRFKLGHNE